MDETTIFLEALHGTAPELGNVFSVWTYPNKETKFFQDIAEAVAHCQKASADGLNVYVGAGHLAEPPAKGRGESSDVVALPALFADIDILGDGHADKRKYPKDQDAAMRLLESLGPEPTLLVHSGHGLQAWWRFKEPLDDMEQAATFLRAWNDTIRAVARQQGTDVDPVKDLARVMRVPGTMNRKKGLEPVPARLLSAGGPTYSFDALEQYLVEEPREGEKARPAPKPIVVDPPKNAAAPRELLDLLEVDTNTRQWWERRRDDMADTSPSGYDLCIANEGVYRGWSDQVIAQCMYAWRSRHGENPEKAQRPDYLARTIARARERSVQRDSDTAGESSKTREWLTARFGYEFKAFIKYVGNPSEYEIQLGGRRILLGPSKTVLSAKAVEQKFFDNDLDFPELKPKDWKVVYEKLRSVQIVDTQIAESRKEITKERLGDYFEERVVHDGPHWREAVATKEPFIDGNNHLGVCLGDLKSFIEVNTGERLTRLNHDLRELGFSKRFAKRPCGTRGRRYFCIELEKVSDLVPSESRRSHREEGRQADDKQV